jgi:hypothetical protein
MVAVVVRLLDHYQQVRTKMYVLKQTKVEKRSFTLLEKVNNIQTQFQ